MSQETCDTLEMLKNEDPLLIEEIQKGTVNVIYHLNRCRLCHQFLSLGLHPDIPLPKPFIDFQKHQEMFVGVVKWVEANTDLTKGREVFIPEHPEHFHSFDASRRQQCFFLKRYKKTYAFLEALVFKDESVLHAMRCKHCYEAILIVLTFVDVNWIDFSERDAFPALPEIEDLWKFINKSRDQDLNAFLRLLKYSPAGRRFLQTML